MTATFAYDIETYPNIFTLAATRIEDGSEWFFEISDRMDQSKELYAFLIALQNSKARMVGFNNIGFDYPIIHLFMQSKEQGSVCSYFDLYSKCQAIINSERGSFAHTIWEDDRYIAQIDLYKIHHFDNQAKSTGLKMLEFNMRSPNIKDLPFPPGTYLSFEEMDVLGGYNKHDVSETVKFLIHSNDSIRFREELSVKYNRNFLNHNDTKIGKDYFIMRLQQAGVPCGKDIQTRRHSVALVDAIFPYVQFVHPEFQRILNWFKSQTITETKGIFKDIVATIDGFKFVFGLGGIHGSVESQIVTSDDEYVVKDADVASYYPNLAIKNRIYPEHLSETFCDIYADMYQQRKGYAKGTPENAMLKLALNGTFGDSNNKYSPFYDPLFMLGITINGQLLLCMLAEQLMMIPGLQMIQINTDGLTVRMPRSVEPMYQTICDWWQQFTCLDLEYAEYSRMFIRDVNNYIAEGTDGKLKRKGAYGYETPLVNPTTLEREWHSNHSALVVPKAAEAALVYGQDITDFIINHKDIYDFMLRTKVPRSSRLELVENEGSIVDCHNQLQNITRYYVTNTGGALVKVMPPTPGQVMKNADAPERRIGICVGWLVTECNDINDATVPINLDYYVQETQKLVECMR